jgi:hypothetical protein
MLTKDEAISLALYWGDGKINSEVVLQKTVARLLSFLIPLECEFKLNKYGSDCLEIRESSNTEFYEKSEYNWSCGKGKKYILTNKGNELAKQTIQKIKNLISENELINVKNEITLVSKMNANEASQNEHLKLLIDEDMRPKLSYRIKNVHISLLDIYNEIKNNEAINTAQISLYGLIEYAFYLSKFIMEKRFKGIENKGYDFDADMKDYYYLEYLEKLIDVIKENLNNPNEKMLDNHYNRMLNFANEGYPFSLNNPDLMSLIK